MNDQATAPVITNQVANTIDRAAADKITFLGMSLTASGLLVACSLFFLGWAVRWPAHWWLPFIACAAAFFPGLFLLLANTNLRTTILNALLHEEGPEGDESRLRQKSVDLVFAGGVWGLILISFVIITTGGISSNPWAGYLVVIPALAGLLRLPNKKVMGLGKFAFVLIIMMFILEWIFGYIGYGQWALDFRVTQQGPSLGQQLPSIPSLFSSAIAILASVGYTIFSFFYLGRVPCHSAVREKDIQGKYTLWHCADDCTLIKRSAVFRNLWKLKKDQKKKLLQLDQNEGTP